MHLADWSPVFLSLKVAVLAVLLVAVIGVPLARVMARVEFHGKDIVEAALTLPLVLPPSVVGYGLLMCIGKNSPLGQLLDSFGVTLIFTWYAAIIASSVVSFPLMYQSVKAAFQSVDQTLEEAARTLGATEPRVFFTITLPLAWPGIVSGIVLSFARALGEFGATLMVAGNIPGRTQTIPLAIFFAVDAGDNATAGTLVLLTTIFSFLVILWVNTWSRRQRRYLER
ncbi:molybdate ABC transporter permease subunit [Syntrophaceticus schinkii]|uniref:Molybdenum transport system permease n=1 Tax=Syntrophaceticus schinkii TaxID=499207 RepID=A0A0B7MDJ5_9FIRM|nr:molybdate ABC transporter permease subunit [Syntrophaceticus schinkii]MDD2358893.1 molybdate ABC transporter permease subunit [Syntrophaceticus schinkii]MDD4260943.1 molybdate ABC transporter permease subunit [Syntrophaceticus schinkii]MDD4674081.1 molybdate ABC transporter permease subunit [Syntrophaceticus schinkii]CEO88165.1 molybdate transporter subunit; membrane component of ABC superfamily [Syntrophaceticus schinkii]